MHKHPLAEYEQKYIHHTSFFTLLFRGVKFLMVYLLLSGTIFSVLLGMLNFGAYSARVLDWMDPQKLISLQEDLSNAIARSSIEVHADTTEQARDLVESREAVTERVADIAPGLVYGRTYSPDNLLANVDMRTSSQATFDVAPYENRIIIPKIGKNIPLVDVYHDAGTSFTQMHEIFMEELKKGVVRYP